MYNIGDKIVYPMHGAGVIESIEEKEILGEKQNYYVVRIPVGDMKILIPIKNIEDVGIRQIIDQKDLDAAFLTLENTPSTTNPNWTKRYRENMDKIKTGNIVDVADVVKTLMQRDKEKGLSTGERKMLSSAKQILISELILVKNINQVEAEDVMNMYLKM